MLTTKRIAAIALAAITLTLGACGPGGGTIEEQRANALQMRDDMIAEFETAPEGGADKLEGAAGYAVFSNVGVKLFFISAGGGYGVVHDNQTDEDIIMKMATGGAGLGLGVEGIKTVLIFKTPASLRRFINAGWQTGASANAAAVAEDTAGGAATAQADFGPDVDIYKFTKNGLALSATVDIAKYWVDGELNPGRNPPEGVDG